MRVQLFLIALGGNLPSKAGGPKDTLGAALDGLAETGVQIQAVSRFYQTPCFPAGAGPDYVNAAACVGFDGAAADLLRLLHQVEAEFGREREQRWGRRTLDLDLIAAGDTVLPDRQVHEDWRALPPESQARETPGRLIVPHPRVQDRAFVLVPLADIAPEWRHPVLDKTVLEMLKQLSDKDIAGVKPL